MGMSVTWIFIGWVRSGGVERGRKASRGGEVSGQRASRKSWSAKPADATRSYGKYARILSGI